MVVLSSFNKYIHLSVLVFPDHFLNWCFSTVSCGQTYETYRIKLVQKRHYWNIERHVCSPIHSVNNNMDEDNSNQGNCCPQESSAWMIPVQHRVDVMLPILSPTAQGKVNKVEDQIAVQIKRFGFYPTFRNERYNGYLAATKTGM